MRRSTLGRRFTALSIPIVATLLATLSPAVAQVPTAPPSTQQEWTPRAEQLELQLRALGESDPDFASVSVDPKRRTVVVHRKGGATQTRYTSARRDTDINLEFTAAPLSRKQARALMDVIHNQKAELAALGINLLSVRSTFRGPVMIGVSNPTPEVSDLLTKRYSSYGPGAITVVQGEVMTANAGRDFNTSPFRAGAHINAAAGFARCTSGFTGRSTTNGAHYMLTAWHCVNNADRRFWASNAAGTTGGKLIGEATVLDQSHDIAYIRVPAGTTPQVWDGPVSAPFTKNVTYVFAPFEGMTNLCASGSFTGVSCYATIIDSGWTPIDLNRDGIADFSAWLYTASHESGQRLAQGGDSGGPVFRPLGSGVAAVGIISATNDNGNFIAFSDVWTEAYINHDIDVTQ